MAKESNIVTIINNTLISEQFSASKFKKGNFKAIVELVKTNKEGETFPGVVANNGEITRCGLNDIIPFQIYHRVLGAQFELDEDGFGDFREKAQTTQMTLICIADRERLGVTKEQIVTALSMGFLSQLDATNRAALSLLTCNITAGSFTTDAVEVYNREFSIESKWLKPQTVMVALDYIIETTVNESCIEICA